MSRARPYDTNLDCLQSIVDGRSGLRPGSPSTLDEPRRAVPCAGLFGMTQVEATNFETHWVRSCRRLVERCDRDL